MSLNNLSPYEFASKICEVPNLHYHPLLTSHPQHETHTLHEYKVPQIPVIQGYHIPSFKTNYESYTQTMCILFFPWRTFLDVKKPLHNMLAASCIPQMAALSINFAKNNL